MSKFEAGSSKTWKSVTRPMPNRGVAAEVSLMNGPPAIAQKTPPAVAPKPGGKMWMYLYESPETKSKPQSGPNIHYPRSNECVNSEKPKWKRIRRYVPAEESPTNSKGGRMFLKQKKRMDEHVLTTPRNNERNPESNQRDNNAPTEKRRAAYARDYSRHTPDGSKNMPALVNNTMTVKNKRKNWGPVIRPLRSPPPEWRAKVEGDYRLSDDPHYPSNRWMQEDLVYEAGYESAPPEDISYNDVEFTNYAGDNGVYAGSFHGSRAGSRGDGPATAAFYFNAKQNNRPQYIARKHASRDAFVAAPYSENDFNARAVGWSRAYVKQY